MIVIDSSILVMYFTREPGWEKAREIILRVGVTVDLAVKEVANALWKKVRRGEMPLEHASSIIADLLRGNVVKIVRHEPLLPEALKVAVEEDITIYDALFIVLARKLSYPLATADKRQAEVARKLKIQA
nr:type II toxin-antitoxin system VapC family toxin [Desulfurococcales archaeon]